MVLLIVTIGVSVPSLYKKYGMQRTSQLDDRDIEHWQYLNGVIVGAEEINIQGSKEECWLLIHGYIASPDEFSELADKIHNETGDTVRAIRLTGHGEVPSKVIGKNIYDWYLEADKAYLDMAKTCGQVNLVGQSMGGAIVLRIAEERDTGNIYVLSPWIYLYPKATAEWKLKLFGWIANYKIKPTSGKVNDPEMQGKHIGYLNMPLDPVLDSLKLIKETRKRLSEIDEPILVQQSTGDTTTDIKGAILLYDEVSSTVKDSKIYERSNHLLLEDYDREKVMEEILKFNRRANR